MEKMRDVAATKRTQFEDRQVQIRAWTLPHINKMALTKLPFLPDLEVLLLSNEGNNSIRIHNYGHSINTQQD